MLKPLVPALAAAVCLHILFLSVVWVGFPVPLPRSGVDFFYGGPSLPGGLAEEAEGPKPPMPAVAVQSPDAGFFQPWLDMRDLNKPRG